MGAQFCKERVCADTTTKSCASPNANTTVGCEVGTYCNGTTCVPAIGLNQHGCRNGGPSGGPIPCYDATQDLTCNNSGICVVKALLPAEGETGCQNTGCAGLLICTLNTTYPDMSSPNSYVCLKGKQQVGQACNTSADCAGALSCESDKKVCYARFSLPVNEHCDYAWDCLPGLTCQSNTSTCQHVVSSNATCSTLAEGVTGSCASTYEECLCPPGYLGGETGYCISDYIEPAFAPYSQDFANAEIALLNCMYNNCPHVDSYDLCSSCNQEMCTYYDQLAAVGETFVPRTHPFFLCQTTTEAEIHDFIMDWDIGHVNSVCGTDSIPKTTGPTTSGSQTTGAQTTGNTPSAASAVVASLSGLVVISLLL